jgi:PRTRC genetic system protein C
LSQFRGAVQSGAKTVNNSVNLQNKKKKEWHMTIRKMTRSFRYAGLILPDPATDLDVESVRSLYAASYPEITTAALTGPEAVDGTLVYTFTKAIGTKG